MGARWSSTTKRVVIALFALAALYIVYRAGDIVRPFVWAGVLAYVLLPVVAVLERRLSLPRTAAAAIVFLGLLAAIIGGGRLLVPLAIDQVRELQRTLPTLVANAQTSLAETADQVGLEDLDALIANVGGIGDLTQMVARGAVPFIVGFGHFLLELLVFLIATFFLLRDAPRLFQWLRRLLPPSQRNEIIPLFAQVNTLLGRYVRGQIFLIGVMATVTVIGLSVLQVPFALLLALMTGVLEVIPIVGPITAGAIACLVALGHPAPWGLSQIWYVAIVAAMYTVLRHLEDYFLIPLSAALLQGTVAPLIAIGAARPSLPILVAGCWAVAAGAREAVWWAFLGGLASDLLSGGPLGAFALASLPPVAAIGVRDRGSTRPTSIVVGALLVGIAALVAALLYL